MNDVQGLTPADVVLRWTTRLYGDDCFDLLTLVDAYESARLAGNAYEKLEREFEAQAQAGRRQWQDWKLLEDDESGLSIGRVRDDAFSAAARLARECRRQLEGANEYVTLARIRTELAGAQPGGGHEYACLPPDGPRTACSRPRKNTSQETSRGRVAGRQRRTRHAAIREIEPTPADRKSRRRGSLLNGCRPTPAAHR